MSTILDQFKLPETTVKVEELQTKLTALENHRVFSLINTPADLRTVMQVHAYAVWVSMLFVKRIQTEYTGYRFPWTPSEQPKLTRLVNEMVLTEESGDDGAGGHCSHFAMYFKAMEEVGAETETLNDFIMNARMGLPPVQAASRALSSLSTELKTEILAYLSTSNQYAANGVTEQALTYFVFGQQDPIITAFSTVLEQQSEEQTLTPTLAIYVEQQKQRAVLHVAYVLEMLKVELEGNAIRTQTALLAAIAAVDARIVLWNAVAVQLEQLTPVAE